MKFSYSQWATENKRWQANGLHQLREVKKRFLGLVP